MKLPQLRKQEEKKTCHGYVWEDYYSWVHQTNCLEILQDKNKLNSEVKKYLEEENTFTEKSMELGVFQQSYIVMKALLEMRAFLQKIYLSKFINI